MGKQSRARQDRARQAPVKGRGAARRSTVQGRASPAAQGRRRGGVPLAAIVVGLIALVALVAVMISRQAGNGGRVGAVPAGVEQTRPVRITGEPLPAFDENAARDPALGARMPELQGASFDGRPLGIVDDGKPKLVLFLAHWCPHCRREVPVIERWVRSGKPPAGVSLYSVATATSSDRPNYPPSAWLQREGWSLPVMADDAQGSAASAFGLTSFPYFVLVDGSGKVVARSTGELTPSQLDQLVAKVRPGA